MMPLHRDQSLYPTQPTLSTCAAKPLPLGLTITHNFFKLQIGSLNGPNGRYGLDGQP